MSLLEHAKRAIWARCVVSAALTEWNTERTARIDDLLYVHRQTGGAGRGRRWRTEQLNWALVL